MENVSNHVSKNGLGMTFGKDNTDNTNDFRIISWYFLDISFIDCIVRSFGQEFNAKSVGPLRPGRPGRNPLWALNHEKHGKWIIFWYGFNHLYNIIQLQVDKWWLMDDYHILSFHREGNHKFLLGYSWYKIGWEYDVQKRWFVWGQPPQDEWMCQGRWIAVVQTENWQYYGV